MLRKTLWIGCIATLISAGVALGALAVRRFPQSLTAGAANNIKSPTCGRADDGEVHVPANWDSFPIPVRGGSYVDRAFGCTVVRLTDSRQDGVAEHHYYATLTPLSADDSKVLVNDEHGEWHVINLHGEVIVPASGMPARNNGTLLWNASEGDVFYYAHGNALMKATIGQGSVRTAAVHEFREYEVVVLPDKADLSNDGQSFAMWGGHTTETGPLDIFTYNMRTNMKKKPYTTACSQMVSYVQGGCVHGIVQTADDNVVIGFANDGHCKECGNRLWDGSVLTNVQDATNHIDTGYDLSGRSIYIGMGNSQTMADLRNACESGWGLDVRNLANPNDANCLMDRQPDWHVSFRGSASQPWAAISFFDEKKDGPEMFSTTAGYRPPSERDWKKYEDEIALARIDGRAIYRLAHARSRSAEGFWAQPRAAISRDGKYVIFDSNMAYSKEGCPPGIQDCADVYAIRVN